MYYPYDYWPQARRPMPDPMINRGFFDDPDFDRRNPFDPRWRGFGGWEPSPYNPRELSRGGPPREIREIDILTRGGGSCGGDFRSLQTLSPEDFVAPATESRTRMDSTQPMISSELLRCGKALREVAPDLDSNDETTRTNAHRSATAHFFYALGLLASKGIFITPDIAGRGADSQSRASDGCERLGREIDRLIGGRGGFETAGRIADAAKECFSRLGSFDPRIGDVIVNDPQPADLGPEPEVQPAAGTRGGGNAVTRQPGSKYR
jgi:hypothetical protein